VPKLLGKERVGAKLRERYDAARTPYRRLEAEHAPLRPLALRHQLDAAVRQLERRRARPTAPESAAAG
jgi:hypothetical protein